MNKSGFKKVTVIIGFVIALIFMGLPVSATDTTGNGLAPATSPPDTYSGVTVAARATSNNYKIQFTGSDSNIIIGNGTTTFTPSFTVNRWSETSFTLSLTSPTMSNLGDGNLSPSSQVASANIISFSNSYYAIKFNPVDNTTGMNELGGLDMTITLGGKPASSILSFNYTQNGVNAYLQPSLTKEFTVGQTLPDGTQVASVTDTEVENTDGNIVASRPDYVVNSIAFYAAGKNGDYSSMGGKDYESGKIGQLYRMKAIDINGNWAWLDWSMPTSTQMLLTDTTGFFQTASYPVIIQPSGDLFGLNSYGSSSMSPDWNHIFSTGSVFLFASI